MKQTILFQILSDETRLRALALMSREGELCVCELVQTLDVSQPKISRHLAAMRDAGIVVQRRHAQWMFYHIDPSLPDWQRSAIEAAVSGVEEEAVIKQDRHRLDAMKNRPDRISAA